MQCKTSILLGIHSLHFTHFWVLNTFCARSNFTMLKTYDMAKLIDTTTQKHHIQEMHIKRWLKGLFILLLTLIFVTASLYASHTDSIRYSAHTTGGIYYDRCFIILSGLTLATLFLFCFGCWRWKHRLHHK